MALLVLKKDVTIMDGVVETIGLPTSDAHYAEGTTVTVVGWGDISGEDEMADTLQELEYKIANQEDCKEHWNEFYGVEEGDIDPAITGSFFSLLFSYTATS